MKLRRYDHFYIFLSFQYICFLRIYRISMYVHDLTKRQ